MSAFERYAVQRVVDKATAAGVEVPPEVTAWLDHGSWGTTGGRLWVEANPEDPDPSPGCCWGNLHNGPEGCTCWEPVFTVAQAEPRPPASPADIQAQPSMCGDCAFRPGSPERTDGFAEEALMESTNSLNTPFWCHAGMRRRARWTHPDGRTVAGCTADWQPPIIHRVPYRADGRPGLLCAGWVALAARNTSPQPG